VVFYFDGTACSFINRLTVTHGSNQLEDITNYNQVFQGVMDLNVADSTVWGGSCILGTNASTARKGQVITATQQLTVCLPLLSGIIGQASEKMIPLHNLADDLQLTLVFEDTATAVVVASGTSADWTITNAELVCTVLEIGDYGMEQINSVSPPSEPRIIHGTSWRTSVSALPANTTGDFSVLVPSRFASLRHLMVLPRRSTEQTGVTSYSLSSRVNPLISQYNWSLGSLQVPSKPIRLIDSKTAGFAEGYAECVKSFHNLSNGQYGSLDYPMYNVVDSSMAGVPVTSVVTNVTANSYKNGFVIATDLEAYSKRSSTMLSGFNTMSSNCFFQCQIASPGPAVNYSLTFCYNFDFLLILVDGLYTIKY